jgi:thiosulfate reductase cytochrome b subunit
VRLAGSVLALVLGAGVVVLAARGVTTLPGVPEFLQRYPGSSEPPDTVEPGFPGWVRWTHFLNAFFMILIIRTGWQVRTQRMPPAYWSSRRSGRRFSLTLWAHLLVDALWLLNGVAFVVLLFASGRWARIVPTSWDALPNAASALLQYLTLEWPVEDGWANYNSLQQIMYFLVVFVAAPLTLLTGLRMSAWWPRRFEPLGRVFPVEAARVLHFLTMSFFVVFIVVHVFLVFATGALRNLNHMFWGADSPGWAGFIWFAMAVLATAGAVAAMRPVLIAPLAGRFGTVSTK